MRSTLSVNYQGPRSYRRVQQAVEITNELLRAPEFYHSIALSPRFALSSASSQRIAELMESASISMSLNLYYALSPLYNIDGYDDLADPTVIHLNIWRLDRSVESLCNSMIHACVHAVNAQANRLHFSQYYFGHGPATGVTRVNTAPYAIGAMAQCLLSASDSVILPLEHDPYVTAARATHSTVRQMVAEM